MDLFIVSLMFVSLIVTVLSVIYLVKHKSCQTKFSKWSDGRMTEHDSFFNVRVLYGYALIGFAAIMGGLIHMLLLRTGIDPESPILTASFIVTMVGAAVLFWVLVAKQRTGQLTFDKLTAIELLYGAVTAIALFVTFSIPFGFLAVTAGVTALMFWFGYKTMRKYFDKWSDGELKVPEKRYNMLMLHGLGFFAFIGVAGVAAFFLGNFVFSLISPEEHISVQKESVVWSTYLTLLAVVFAIYAYWLIVYNNRKKSGATKKQVRWEIIYGCTALVSWIAAIVIGSYAVVILLILIVLYAAIRIFSFFAFGEKITVKSGGLFGGTKEVYAERNLDGSYTDAEGNKYK